MKQTFPTPHPDNIMADDINNPTPRNNAWKYEAKNLGSEELCTMRTLNLA